MTKKVLLTSFTTWLPHQQSNAADDLLEHLENQTFTSLNLNYLRKLPVNVEQSSQRAIATINSLQPHAIICCGMAESRHQLTVESNATCQGHKLETNLNLESLIAELQFTDISHDAGKFVCEGLYYQVLAHVSQFYQQTSCLFVHIPIITHHNLDLITEDFVAILHYCLSMSPKKAE